MNYIILLMSIVMAILPIYLIGYYFYQKDTIKEPKKLLIKLFLSGFLSGLIVIFVSVIGIILFPNFVHAENIHDIFELFFYCFIFVATVEELSKIIMIYYLSYNSKEFDQAFDIILYSVFVGLGFACFENIIYLLGNSFTISTALIRGITAVPAHVCFQTIMGYYLYLSKAKDKNINISLSIIIPIIMHGTYDYLVFSQHFLITLLFVVLLIGYIIYANSKIKLLVEIDKLNLIKYCPKCGNRIRFKYCSKCGYKKNNGSTTSGVK